MISNGVKNFNRHDHAATATCATTTVAGTSNPLPSVKTKPNTSPPISMTATTKSFHAGSTFPNTDMAS